MIFTPVPKAQGLFKKCLAKFNLDDVFASNAKFLAFLTCKFTYIVKLTAHIKY